MPAELGNAAQAAAGAVLAGVTMSPDSAGVAGRDPLWRPLLACCGLVMGAASAVAVLVLRLAGAAGVGEGSREPGLQAEGVARAELELRTYAGVPCVTGFAAGDIADAAGPGCWLFCRLPAG